MTVPLRTLKPCAPVPSAAPQAATAAPQPALALPLVAVDDDVSDWVGYEATHPLTWIPDRPAR